MKDYCTPAQEKILRAFNSESYLSERLCVVDYALYDRCRMVHPGEPTPHTFRFFDIPIGAPNLWDGATKTIMDTNLRRSNMLLSPEAFALTKSIFFLISRGMHRADQNRLLDEYMWEFRMGRKWYAQGPLGRFPNIIDILAIKPKPFTVIADKPEVQSRNDDWLRRMGYACPDLAAMNKTEQSIPLVIENEQNFSLIVTGNPFRTEPDGTGINFLGVLDGIGALPVQ